MYTLKRHVGSWELVLEYFTGEKVSVAFFARKRDAVSVRDILNTLATVEAA